LGPQFEVFLQKYPFPSANAIAKYFLVTIPTVREILQKELGMKKFSRRWVPHSLSSVPKVATVEASKEILKILQESETNYFDEIATDNEVLVSISRFLFENVWPFAIRCRSEDETGVRHKKNYDHVLLYRKETNRSRCPAKR
jgi:hypothetical protein